MFPRFDKLSDAEIDANAALLQLVGFSDGRSAAQALSRIYGLWKQSTSENSTSTASPGLRTVFSPESDPDKVVSADTAPAWYQGLERILLGTPLPDTVVNVIEQFVRNSIGQHDPFRLFEKTPRALDILARTACSSPFLTQTLLADPGSLSSLMNSGRTAEMKAREQFIVEAEAAVSQPQNSVRGMAEIRHYQRRELLRIGMCDAFGLLDLRYVTLQLSLLADAMVQVCLNRAAKETGQRADMLTVIALGKHGGEELNYSSDIDLILISEKDSPHAQRLARLTIDGLSENLPPGFLYRVDLRLRPWGDAGPLVSTPEAYAQYLRNDAALWERQALLKARTVAGNFSLGRQFLKLIQPLLFRDAGADVRFGIQQMKERIELRLKQRGKQTAEVKLGAGTIRDVEFLVQYLQLTHGKHESRVLSCNTLESLVRLAEFGLLSPAWYRQLRAGYVFLRTVEHSVQLLHNQQTHELPPDPRQMAWLAHRLDYPDADILLKRFEEHRHAVRSIFEECVGTSTGRSSLTQFSPSDSQAAESSSGGLVDRTANQGRIVNSKTSEPRDQLISSARSVVMPHEQRLIDQMAEHATTGDVVAVHCRLMSASEIPQASPADSAGTLQLILCGLDFPNWLSKVCGVLAIYSLDIRSGDALGSGGTNRFGHRCPDGNFLAVFQVRPSQLNDVRQPANESPSALASRLQEELSGMVRRIRAGQAEDVRSDLLSRFCDVVQQLVPAGESLTSLNVDVAPDDPSGQTRLDISGTDTAGFLFELSHALSLSRFRITRAIVDSHDDQVRDVLYVTELDGGPVQQPDRIQELRIAVALIKQFTHWLPSTSNPRRALQRFRELVNRLRPAAPGTVSTPESDDLRRSRDIQSLQNPDVLHAVARMLGIGQYLWEEFLRSRHEDLFPLLANARELADRIDRKSLDQKLHAVIDDAADHQAAWKALNQFKDRHLFRIDMRHVMGYCRPFGAFSEEITELAEIVVCAAIRLAWNELTRLHGIPSGERNTSPCHYSVAGLGKFGGTEMGYASDIELILIYSDAGLTSGPDSISNARFFDQLVAAVATGISARQDGIFHVDLRMRPFGNAGSAAVLLSDFSSYYRSDGPAWPYERQAMVKFRCVSGDPEFSRRVTKICHEAIYSVGTFDFASMRAMRERQIRQLVRGGTINAKLSDGGLVDCEYAVQALQLTFGGDLPLLRHPNTRQVLRTAARLSLISPEQQSRIEDAYVFLRQLIDCLRMVRGNARDLTVPDSGTADYEQLGRRLESIHDSQITLQDLEHQMQIVREFSKSVEQHCRALRLGRGQK